MMGWVSVGSVAAALWGKDPLSSDIDTGTVVA